MALYFPFPFLPIFLRWHGAFVEIWIEGFVRRVQKIEVYFPFLFLPIFLPCHEAFVEIWIERLDFPFDVSPNNGLVFRTLPDQFHSPFILFL